MRLFCTAFFCMLLGYRALSQASSSIPCLTLNALKNGVLFENNTYFNKVGVLFQDTCSSFNRFDRSFFYGQKMPITPAFYQAIIVDSTTALSIEVQLKDTIVKPSDSVQVDVINGSRKVRKFIRLYAGFINEIGDTCVVIQYVTNREYAKDRYYSKQLNLIAAKNRPLRFIVFEKRANKWRIRSLFPHDFL
jgi:hypothetical protein